MIQKKHISSVLGILRNLETYRVVNSVPAFGPYKRVYHYHVMKTGGTSINQMFLALSKNVSVDPAQLYIRLMESRDARVITDRYVYVAWNHLLVRLGLFSYAWSHRPFYKIKLPADCFSITCLRHPYDRVYSRYKHVRKNIESGQLQGHSQREVEYASGSFEEYISRIPDSELCHQLYFFSENGNVGDALNNLQKVNLIMTLPTLESDVEKLNKSLGIELEFLHVRKVSGSEDKRDVYDAFDSVSERILPEVEFYERACALKDTLSASDTVM